MADKFRTHHIILVISRRGIISVAIGERGSIGTNEVTVHVVIIIVFRISTTIVVTKGIIISVDFGFFVIGLYEGVIFGVAFGCSKACFRLGHYCYNNPGMSLGASLGTSLGALLGTLLE